MTEFPYKDWRCFAWRFSVHFVAPPYNLRHEAENTAMISWLKIALSTALVLCPTLIFGQSAPRVRPRPVQSSLRFFHPEGIGGTRVTIADVLNMLVETQGMDISRIDSKPFFFSSKLQVVGRPCGGLPFLGLNYWEVLQRISKENNLTVNLSSIPKHLSFDRSWGEDDDLVPVLNQAKCYDEFLVVHKTSQGENGQKLYLGIAPTPNCLDHFTATEFTVTDAKRKILPITDVNRSYGNKPFGINTWSFQIPKGARASNSSKDRAVKMSGHIRGFATIAEWQVRVSGEIKSDFSLPCGTTVHVEDCGVVDKFVFDDLEQTGSTGNPDRLFRATLKDETGNTLFLPFLPNSKARFAEKFLDDEIWDSTREHFSGKHLLQISGAFSVDEQRRPTHVRHYVQSSLSEETLLESVVYDESQAFAEDVPVYVLITLAVPRELHFSFRLED